jgi:nucleotide-binding universal stress UspA family protein
VGSFIIGLFAALTASDGRFTTHPDARAFVMVGICGGYTTFSSFSLQTLDLARDGKLGAAFANIALSVVLCLLAVSAGYVSAAMIASAAPQVQTSKGKSMGEVILAVLDHPESIKSVLSGAARLLDFGGGGRVEALAVRTPPINTIMFTDQVLTTSEEARLRSAEHAWASEVETVLVQWEADAKAKAIDTDWVDVEGDIAQLVAERGRRSDMVVVARTVLHSERSRDALHAAIFDTSRAVLIVPPHGTSEFGRVVAVAWKDDSRAPKAVLAALPILVKAETVHVLQANISQRAIAIPAILQKHGVAAYPHAVQTHGEPVGARLLRLAHELGADLVVMGAYAHGEWREALLGGVTRYMLDHADLPVLMRH